MGRSGSKTDLNFDHQNAESDGNDDDDVGAGFKTDTCSESDLDEGEQQGEGITRRRKTNPRSEVKHATICRR